MYCEAMLHGVVLEISFSSPCRRRICPSLLCLFICGALFIHLFPKFLSIPFSLILPIFESYFARVFMFFSLCRSLITMVKARPSGPRWLCPASSWTFASGTAMWVASWWSCAKTWCHVPLKTSEPFVRANGALAIATPSFTV